MFLPSRVTVPLLTAAFALASDQFDYVVVGGGTAGLTAATRLTENPNIKVAVIEAGASPNITDYRLLNLVFGTGFQWDIPTVPQASAGNRVYPQIQGKALGGSSAINGAVYLRPDVREYEAIQALGAKGWTWEKFLEYFKRSERFDTTGDVLTVQPNTSAHGTSGPIHVSYQHNISSFFKEYALPTIKAANQTITDDISDGWHPVGASPQQISIDSNLTRSYAANMYYFPNRNRENLKVFTETLVSKIIWGADNEDGSAVATGVEYITADNGTFSLNAKNIIVSAGTLNTPKVLELSGVGDSSILKDRRNSTFSSLGIDVKLDVPGVGKNLQNQFGINVQFELKSGIELVATLQSPLIDLVPLQQALSAEDQATSAEILSTANDGIPQDQFEALKNLISQGVAQTEINWSLQPGTNGSYILQFYTTNLHTFSRGTSVRIWMLFPILACG
ncbi:hypothetical protein L218DRAFT_884738 [Marasmius fiardii PR-910]|nr:hypothetical protein L218DRAFT_884738 [Marasmius fiardii PR-910]